MLAAQARLAGFLGLEHPAFQHLVQDSWSLHVALGGAELVIEDLGLLRRSYSSEILDEWISSSLHNVTSVSVRLAKDADEDDWTFYQTLLDTIIARAEDELVIELESQTKASFDIATKSLSLRVRPLVVKGIKWHSETSATELFDHIAAHLDQCARFSLWYHHPLMYRELPQLDAVWLPNGQQGLAVMRDAAIFASSHGAKMVVESVANLRELFLVWAATQERIARAVVELREATVSSNAKSALEDLHQTCGTFRVDNLRCVPVTDVEEGAFYIRVLRIAVTRQPFTEVNV